MTLDQINLALLAASRIAEVDHELFAKNIALIVRTEMLAIAKANTVLSNDANELYQDLQAYDRFERGLNF